MPSQPMVGRKVLLTRAVPLIAFLGFSCSCQRASVVEADPRPPDVVTYHYDNARTGQALNETLLTPANVNSANFGKTEFFPVDGKVDAQALYLAQVKIGNQGIHNALFVVTEHDSVYAFDAESGKVLWQKSLLLPGEIPSDDRNCAQVSPEIGITATPVIDRSRGPNGTLYAVAMSKDENGKYYQRLHALDVSNGDEVLNGPRLITASYPGKGDNSVNGKVVFDPEQYEDRAALLLVNGTIYTTWASHCDARPYTGWIVGYSASTLNQMSVLNVTPNGNEGAIWMSGAGPAADGAGNIYALDGNGSFDEELDSRGFPLQGDYGNAFLKLSAAGGRLNVVDYFQMADQSKENADDADLGSGGVIVLPDVKDHAGKVWQLAVGAGKDKNIYVVDRNSMGKFHRDGNHIHQEMVAALGGGVFSKPAYYKGTVYYGGMEDKIRAFPIVDAKLQTQPSSMTPNIFHYPGTTPVVSANGSRDAILWAVENGDPAVLHAYDATNLARELYNSNQAGSRDHFGPGNKFITPMVANGKVYVGTTNGVAVFGLLH